MRRWMAWMVLGLVGCGAAPEPAREAGLPRSVVLFAPSMTEAACALGFADRIVAITDYDRWPPEILDRPRIGGALDPDLERLAVLEPDLLVLQGESTRLRDFATRTGQRIADVKMDDDIASILDGILRLDELLGGRNSQAGEALVERIGAELDSMSAVVRGDRPRALLVLSRNPHSLASVFSAGRGTFFDELLEVAGATNWASAEGYFEVPLDEIVADPPDVVLEHPDVSPEAWADLPGEPIPVVGVDFDGLMIPGPRIAASARALAAALDAAGVR